MIHLGKPGPYYVRKAEGHNQKDRVVSAVWTVISTTEDAIELGLTWPEGSKRQGNGEQEALPCEAHTTKA